MKARRHPAGGQARHADDWLMTYADTITLLLCLFAVLLALHGTKLHHADHVTVPAPAGAPTSSTSPQAAIVIAPLREFAGMPRPQADADDDPDEMPIAHPVLKPTTAAPTIPASPAAETQHAVDASRITAPPSPVTRPVNAPMNAPVAAPMNVRVNVPVNPPMNAGRNPAPDPMGDRITIFQFSSTAFFASATATLSDSGQSILKNLLGRLQSPAFAEYRITVEGHTDDEPISSSQFPSNWELSAARAAAVVRFFIEHGIPADRLRAAGYADTHPLAPNRDAAGNPIPENQAKNRRVVIELEKIDHAGI